MAAMAFPPGEAVFPVLRLYGHLLAVIGGGVPGIFFEDFTEVELIAVAHQGADILRAHFRILPEQFTRV